MLRIDVKKRQPHDTGADDCFILGRWRDLPSRLPLPGSRISFVTHAALTASNLVSLLLSRPVCERCLLTSFNVSVQTAYDLELRLANADLQLLDIIVSESMDRLQPGNTLSVLRDIASRYPARVRVRQADIHAKIYCLAMASGDNWVVECSANLARNSRIELYTIWNSAARFQWHASWIGRALL